MSKVSCISVHPIFLVIPASGSGLRMGGKIPKQFRDLGGISVLEAAIWAFLSPDMPNISGIAISVPQMYLELVKQWQFKIPTWVVVGGQTRQESVQLALKALPDIPQAIVMIHDAIRIFPPSGPIQLGLKALKDWDGVVLGESSTDTLKLIDHNKQIIRTISRDTVFRAQTPQMAKLELWRQAFNWASDSNFRATDDISILEALQKRILLVKSPSSNFKITTLNDWNYAKAIYKKKY